MAIKISNNTVINNNRKGLFQSVNPGVFAPGSRPSSPSQGDIIFDESSGTLFVWNGSSWESTGGTGISTVPAFSNPQSLADGTTDFSEPTSNYGQFGPITIGPNSTLIVADGSYYTVV